MSQIANHSLNLSTKNSRALESLIDFITGFRHELGALTSLYGQLPELIEAEHEAVISGNFILVREATSAKMAVCDQISAAHEALVEQSRKLPRISETLTGRSCEVPATLSECLAQLVDLADEVSRCGDQNSVLAFSRDILQRLLAGSTSSLAAFLDIAESVKPRIEANRLLLEKLAKSYQESYRFWLELAAESQSPYDARGVQRSSHVASGIRVKA